MVRTSYVYGLALMVLFKPSQRVTEYILRGWCKRTADRRDFEFWSLETARLDSGNFASRCPLRNGPLGPVIRSSDRLQNRQNSTQSSRKCLKYPWVKRRKCKRTWRTRDFVVQKWNYNAEEYVRTVRRRSRVSAMHEQPGRGLLSA